MLLHLYAYCTWNIHRTPYIQWFTITTLSQWMLRPMFCMSRMNCGHVYFLRLLMKYSDGCVQNLDNSFRVATSLWYWECTLEPGMMHFSILNEVQKNPFESSKSKGRQEFLAACSLSISNPLKLFEVCSFLLKVFFCCKKTRPWNTFFVFVEDSVSKCLCDVWI